MNMNINEISSQTFGARLATLGEYEYTPKQKSLIRSVERYLRNDDGYNHTNGTGMKFDSIPDDCYIFAKPVGKTGVIFKACVKSYDPFTEWNMWYDKFFMHSKTFSTNVTRTSKDTIKAFDDIVDDLYHVHPDDLLSTWDELAEDKKKTMKYPPRKINIIM